MSPESQSQYRHSDARQTRPVVGECPPITVVFLNGEYWVKDTGAVDWGWLQKSHGDICIADFRLQCGEASRNGRHFTQQRKCIVGRSRRETGPRGRLFRTLLALNEHGGVLTADGQLLARIIHDDGEATLSRDVGRIALERIVADGNVYAGVPSKREDSTHVYRVLRTASSGSGPYRHTWLERLYPYTLRTAAFRRGDLPEVWFRLLSRSTQDRVLGDPRLISNPDRYRYARQ